VPPPSSDADNDGDDEDVKEAAEAGNEADFAADFWNFDPAACASE
jgi:hypothetical protein